LNTEKIKIKNRKMGFTCGDNWEENPRDPFVENEKERLDSEKRRNFADQYGMLRKEEILFGM
jgi:hypothetical protein